MVKKQVHVARCIYEYILNNKKWNNEQVWWDAAQLERKYATIDECQNILCSAVKQCKPCYKYNN